MAMPTNMRRALAVAGIAVLSVMGMSGATAGASAPACDGALTTVVDDQGNQQQACVAQEPNAAPTRTDPVVVDAAAAAGAPAVADIQPQAPSAAVGARQIDVVSSTRRSDLPTTGAGTGVGILIGAALVLAGSATSLLARRRSS